MDVHKQHKRIANPFFSLPLRMPWSELCHIIWAQQDACTASITVTTRKERFIWKPVNFPHSNKQMVLALSDLVMTNGVPCLREAEGSSMCGSHIVIVHHLSSLLKFWQIIIVARIFLWKISIYCNLFFFIDKFCPS